MRLIASGRASEVFALDETRVLRRFKAGGDAIGEARVMEHARRHGFPVPEVLDVQSDALVLARIEGPTMGALLRRRPWELRAQAASLARLHELLHAIEAPTAVPVAGPGNRLLHLDLHPENVLVSPAGPVVIDWTNAARGDAALDVALTWVVLATSGGTGGRILARSFLRHVDRDEIVRALPRAASLRLADVNVSDAERHRVRRMLDRADRGVRRGS